MLTLVSVAILFAIEPVCEWLSFSLLDYIVVGSPVLYYADSIACCNSGNLIIIFCIWFFRFLVSEIVYTFFRVFMYKVTDPRHISSLMNLNTLLLAFISLLSLRVTRGDRFSITCRSLFYRQFLCVLPQIFVKFDYDWFLICGLCLFAFLLSLFV